jgi:hypothetical protein
MEVNDVDDPVLRLAYRRHRNNAKVRGIPHELTFAQWLKIWTDSGHLYQWGKHSGQYCMARFGDEGSYIIGNVRICTVNENHAEMRHSCDTRFRMSADRIGRRHTKEAKAKIGNANRGRTFKLSEETRRRMSIAQKGNKNSLGRKLSDKHKEKIRLSLLGNKRAFGKHWKKSK